MTYPATGFAPKELNDIGRFGGSRFRLRSKTDRNGAATERADRLVQ